MGSPAMNLTEDQLSSIADQVADRLTKTAVPVRTQSETLPMVQLPPEFYQLQRESSDRLARLEERVDQGFASVEKRFEDLIHQMDRRFDQVDKRFEDLIHQMDKRFDQVDKRFEQVDKRFEQVERRFEAVDRRFEQLDKRFAGLVALISVATAIVGGLVVLFQVL